MKNLDRLNAALVDLDERQRQRLESYMLGVLSTSVDVEEWAKIIGRGREFVLRTTVAP